MPAAGAGETLHAGLDAADRHGASRCQQARILLAGHVQEFVQAAEIGPPRREADHGDAIVARPRHAAPRLSSGVVLRRLADILEIDAVLRHHT